MTSSSTRERLNLLKEKVRDFPLEPGIYIMKNANEKIIYVGKAKELRKRVRSYFAEKVDSPKTQLLVRNIHSVEYVLTGTEAEAFLLEASLIKKHRPRYNIRLKDDKSYPYIRLSLSDTFPRFYLARKAKNDGSVYYGPYTSGYVVRETIKFLNRSFQIRDCRDHFMRSRKRPCMTHQIGACKAPCVGRVSEGDYGKDVKKAQKFLQKESSKIVKQLSKEMKKLASEEKFELAARYRDSIQAIERVLEKQAIINAQSFTNQDAIGVFGDERGALVETLHIRSGRMIGQRSQFFPLLNPQDKGEDPRDWLTSFINQYYQENVVPDEILLPMDLGNDIYKLLHQVFQFRGYESTQVRFPTDENGRALVAMAQKNAESHFGDYVSKSEKKKQGLQMIQQKFKLRDKPFRIECYDISHFQGSESVGSQVVFEDGVSSKDHYRRYRLRSNPGGDDYGAMKEVLGRRFKHTEWEEPDLILVDGGKGQLNAAFKILEQMGKSHLPLASIAKERTRRNFKGQAIEKSQERFYRPGRANPVTFAEGSPAFQILTGLRDEAHRFAIEYHRKLREGSSLHSVFDDIPGVGEVLKKRILTEFSSIDEIRQRGIEALEKLPGITKTLAETIHAHLMKASSQ